MKTYEQTIKGVRYWYFYDTNVRSWVVYDVDENDYQVNGAEYFPNKKELLLSYRFDFNKVV